MHTERKDGGKESSMPEKTKDKNRQEPSGSPNVRDILWFIIRNTYLVSVPVSGTEHLKPSEFPKRGVFHYVNEVTLGKYLRVGATRGTNPVIRELEASVSPQLPGRAEGLKIEFKHWGPVM